MLYSYCPKCGGNLKEEKGNLGVCQKCGFNFYINPEPANAGILENEKGEILLVRRAREPKKGLWDFPGGFVNIKESLEDSFKREIREELGVEITDFKYLSSHPSVYPYHGVNKPTIVLNFVAKIESSISLKPTDDISEARFFALTDIPWNQLSFAYVKLGIEDFVSMRRSS